LIDIRCQVIVLGDKIKFGGRNMDYTRQFPSGTVAYQFGSFALLPDLVNNRRVIFLMDTNVFAIYKSLLGDHPAIVIPAGEESKSIATIDRITEQLLQLKADKQTCLVGMGGGVVTDITGFAAAIYMRGISCGFVPTTLLGMVDASIGGKNGVNAGAFKNMIGTIRQPEFILFDEEFLNTLPEQEWSNGFAEIIKYGCIFDTFLFEELLDHDLHYYLNNGDALKVVIRKCVDWKNKTVLEDEKEQGLRKILNFGHTAGHAIEKKQGLPHGVAVGIGMLIATIVSEAAMDLNPEVLELLRRLLIQYQLPAELNFDAEEIMTIMSMDKKRKNNTIDFIVLEKPGKAEIKNIPFEMVNTALVTFRNEGNN
jgi:3-dehydroquinate synthase